MWARVAQHLQDALPEISALMEAEFAAVGTPFPDSKLDQNGLRDGDEIAREYIQHNELGLALEHLCYMVREAGLPISEQAYASLKAAGTEMRMDASFWQSLNPILRQAE